jgi:hypothetical protein
MDQVEVPHDPEAADPERPQPAGRLLPLDGVNGHDRHAEPGQHAPLDRLGVRQHHTRAVGHRVGERPLGHLAGRRSGLSQQERLARRLGRTDVPAPGPRMRRTDDQPVLFTYPGKDFYSSSMLVKPGVPASGGIGPDRDIVAFSTLCTHMGGQLGGTYKGRCKLLGPCPFHLTTFDLAKHGMEAATRRAGVFDLLDRIISVEEVQIFKPSPGSTAWAPSG